MRNQVERLRIYLLGSAIFLLLVIGAFIGAARYLRRHALVAFPTQLAKDVLREAANFTYCQSDARSTRFCIHAAKSIEYSDGKLILRDATITLYGAKGNRSDHIYGDEFEYDKTAQVLRATGVVHIDVEAAGTATHDSALARPVDEGSKRSVTTARVMHITTSGLVYLQKLGVAATSAPVDFESGALTGHAIGADYSSDSALISLHSAVSMSGLSGGHPLAITAATAAFDDDRQQALLTRATYESEGRKASADEATLYRREDGTLSRIAAKGNVTLQSDRGTVVSPQADIALNQQNGPQTAVLAGGVKYTVAEPLRTVNGQADHAEIHFDSDAKPQPDHATFVGGVDMLERVRATAASAEPWSTRELKATQVDVTFDHRPSGSPLLRNAVATGNPHIIFVNNGSLARNSGHGTTELSAATLTGHFTDILSTTGTPQLDTISGRGDTQLQLLTADGRRQTVTADSLDAKLRPQPLARAAGAADNIAQTLWSAVQQGHVQMTQRTPPKAAPDSEGRVHGEEIQHALGDRAVYDGDADRMTLSGGVQLSDPDSVLWSNSVTLDHKTGDAHADGMVKVSYTVEPANGAANFSREPTHLLADRADFVKASGISTFYGKPVRVWQEGNQILAPIVVLSKTQKTISAQGNASTPVRTLIAAADKSAAAVDPIVPAATRTAPQQGCSASGASSGPRANSAGVQSSGTTRITSGGLTYTSASHEANFSGGFLAETADGTIRAREGTVYLRAPSDARSAVGRTAQPASNADFSGELDHIVAEGRVMVDKPGLKATGERLTYTVDDRTAVLTGDAATPPRAVGTQGTTTGHQLRLRELCDGRGGVSVEVLSGPGQPAHTDIRMDEGQSGKGKAKR